MIGLGIGLSRTARRGYAAAAAPPVPPPGTLATAFATTPAVHYHPHSQAAAVAEDNRLTSLPDLRGLADMLAVAGTASPRLMTDALGRGFLRFDSLEAAAIANTLIVASNRSFMVLMVGRQHHNAGVENFLAPRFASFTAPDNNMAAAVSIRYLATYPVSGAPGYLQAGNPLATTNAVDCHKVLPGCQMQVMAAASRVTARGGTRTYINNDSCDTAQQSTVVSGYLGAVIGGAPGANNSEKITPNTSACGFDLYELAIWTEGPANADADAIVAAAVDNYAIPQLDTNLVLEGDSITFGIATVLPESPANCKGLGSRLTEPGAELVPGNVRVINIATSGAKVANLITRRDAANSTFAAGAYPGGAPRNIVAVQIGRNDMVATAGTAASHYANVVALIADPASGYLRRGWRVVAVGNIAGSPTAIPGSPSDGPVTLQDRVEAFRAMLFDGSAINSLFQNDTLSGTGLTYAGLVSVLPLHHATVSGDSMFLTSANASDTTSGYYNSDSTHLRVAGVDLMANGGDDLACGYGAIV